MSNITEMYAVYASAPSPDDPLATLETGPRPEPEVPDGWVRVAVRAASVNMHDLFTLRGVGIRAEAFPMILGCDGAGELDDGTEVVIHGVVGSPEWRDDETLDPQRSILTEKYQGTFADYVAIPARNAIPKPAELSFSEAACMGTAWLTAYRMLFTKSGLRPGETMLVQGASGGVATALITLGRAAGMRVWATGRSEEKRALATELGAHGVFEPGARLPDRVDGVFDTVGGPVWPHSIKSLRPGGVLVTSGATAGEPASIELQRIFFLQLRVLGSTMGTRQELANLLSFCATSGIRPTIGLELPMSEARDALGAMLKGDTAGKIVLNAA